MSIAEDYAFAFDNPTSLKHMGYSIAAIAGFFIVITSFILTIHNAFIPIGGTFQSEEAVFSWFNLIGIIIIAIALLWVFAGMSISRYRSWANWFAQILAVLTIMSVTAITLLSIKFIASIEYVFIQFSIYTTAFFWTIPCALLIWHLNRPGISSLFKHSN